MSTIHGAKGGGGSQQPATEAPDSLHSVARARIIDLVSEGEIYGFVHGDTNPLQDIYLNETPVANADGTLNFQDVQIDSRAGTQSQTYMPGFSGVENEIGVGLELKSTTPWTQSLTDTTIAAVRVRLSVPSLQKSDTSTGDITGYTIAYKIEIATDGGSFVAAVNSAFTGKTTSKYERTHRIDLPAATSGWVIRVTRLTANANLATIADTTTVESYTTILDDKFRYPNSAYVGIIIDSQQFTSIPSRAYDLYGRIISVPSNYNPTTRAYTGTWDGSFKPAYTDSPAWTFYDLATNTRYGLGQYVSAALLNKWALYQIGQYCDGLVNDGFGGQEPRFTCNLFLQTQADAYKVLQDLSSVFRGMAFWAGGAIQAVADMPGDPVYTYTQANVIGGKFTYSGSGRKTRFTTALVSWNDPNDFGRAKVEYVPDNEGIARYGIQQTSVTGFGCTSQAQAHRIGLWTLLTSRLETETVTFAVGLDGTIAAPGQIIRVADSARAGKRQGGRIHSATTMAVTVDLAPTVAAGDSLTCAMAGGFTETRTVQSIAGNVITVTAAFDSAPIADGSWVAESTTLAAQQFRVISVLEDGQGPNLSFTVTALAHNASKFANIDTGAPLTIPSVTAIPPSSQVGPVSVTLSSTAIAGQVLASTLLTVQWPATQDAVYYEVDFQKDNGDWHALGRQYGLAVDISHATPGAYIARVRAINASGIGSVPTVSAAYTVADQTLVPGFVDDLGADAAAAQAAADAANAALANIASDNILSAGEKPVVIRDNTVITTEQAGIDAQATAYAITTEKTAYDGKVSALTSYLATLTSPALWSDLSGNTTIVGATFRQKFADVYTTRQALLNAIYAAAKSKADTAKAAADAAQGTANTANTTANTAIGQVTQLPVINGGFDIAPTGYGWTADAGTGWFTDTTNITPGVGPNCARHNGGTGGAYRNNGMAACNPGQRYKAQALIKAVGANGTAYVYISWCNAGGGEIGTTIGNQITGSTTAGSYADGVAPAGTVYARTCLGASNTAGYYAVDNVVCTQYPASMADVPDGGGRYAAAQAGADKTSSNTANDTAHVAGATASAVSDGAGRAQAGLDSSGYLINGRNNLDRISDSASYTKQPVMGGSAIVVANANFAAPLDSSGNIPGWVPFNSATIATFTTNVAPFTSGMTCLHATFIGSSPQGFGAQSQNIKASAGDTFFLRSWMYSETGGVAYAALMFFGASGAYLGQINALGTVYSTWEQPSAAGSAPAGTALAFLRIGNGGTGGGSSYFTDVALTRVASIDNEVLDGTTYGRTSQNDLYVSGGVNRVGLRVAGSGQRVGDQRNLLTRTIGNIPARVPSVISYSAPSGSTSPVTVTFSLAAFTMQAGSYTVAYGAMSASMSVTRGTAYNVFFYFNDPDQAGGTPTLVATTNAGDVYGGDGFVYVGSVTFTIPTSGGSSGGGGGGGAGGCVDCGQYLPTGQRAWDIVPGDVISGSVGGLDAKPFTVSGSRINDQPCWQLVTASGASVTASESTPMTLRDGTMSMFPDMLGEHVVVMDRDGETRWEQVTHMRYVGLRPVNQISIGGNCYFAGDTQGAYVLTHNNVMPK